MHNDTIETLNLAARTIFEKKGFNILVLDVRGISTLTDFFIIAEGNVDKHVQGLSRELIDVLDKQKGILPLLVEGMEEGEWVVLDYLDFIIHLFTPDLREKYQLEQVWKAGAIVEIDLADVKK